MSYWSVGNPLYCTSASLNRSAIFYNRGESDFAAEFKSSNLDWCSDAANGFIRFWFKKSGVSYSVVYILMFKCDSSISLRSGWTIDFGSGFIILSIDVHDYSKSISGDEMLTTLFYIINYLLRRF